MTPVRPIWMNTIYQSFLFIYIGNYGNRKHFSIHGEDSISAQLTSAILMTGNNEQDHERIAKRQIPSGNATVVEVGVHTCIRTYVRNILCASMFVYAYVPMNMLYHLSVFPTIHQ